jgi:sporadic carbohydrate cluster 2OG-Fe(II) oxygenase
MAKLNFFTQSEIKISDEFKKNGFIIRDAANKDSLNWIQSKFISLIKKKYKFKKKFTNTEILNSFHKIVSKSNLNSFRLNIYESINKDPNFKYHYFQVAKPFIETIAGNELAMQKKVNLSIQLPKDDSSLLAVHSDVWAGDSPFEIVVWLPLVNCFRTKAMYILQPNKNDKFNKKVSKFRYSDNEKVFQLIKKDVKWIKINFGQVLIFNQSLPHGNRVNQESETRWTLNCRFKNTFTPYGDKKIGEFFEPITLRTISELGLKYKLPKMK